ncbi:hypothetical protein GCM10027291_20130 [Telluribacter humicola]
MLPTVGLHGNPYQKELPLPIQKKDRVTIGYTRRIGHKEWGAPGFFPLTEAGSHDPDIIGGPLSAPLKPYCQKVSIRQTDQAAPMHMLLLQGEDQRLTYEMGAGCLGGQVEGENETAKQ